MEDDADIIVLVRGGLVVDVVSNKLLHLKVLVKDWDNAGTDSEPSKDIYKL